MNQPEKNITRYAELALRRKRTGLTPEELAEMKKIRQELDKSEREILVQARKRLTGTK